MEVRCNYHKLVAAKALEPHPKNYRNHPENQLAKIRAVIRANGWRSPVVLSERTGQIIKGHGRVQAMDPDEMVPVEYQHYDSEEDELRDMVADNEVMALAETDDSKLAEILGEIGDLNPEEIGITEPEMDRLLEVLEDNQFLSASDPPESLEDPQESHTSDEREIRSTITFESIAQQEAWERFVEAITEAYPEPTAGASIAAHAADWFESN